MSPNTNFFLLLDSAKMESHIHTAKQLEPGFVSLYRGKSETELADVAPYLLALKKDSELAKWYFTNGFGNAWGIIIETKITLEALRHHLRKFLLVNTEEGQELYFRFYDPSVFNVFIPTCDENQNEEIFGPVEKLYAEEKGGTFVNGYSHNHGKLLKSKLEITDFKQLFLTLPAMQDAEKSDKSETDIPQEKETVFKESDKDMSNIFWS